MLSRYITMDEIARLKIGDVVVVETEIRRITKI